MKFFLETCFGTFNFEHEAAILKCKNILFSKCVGGRMDGDGMMVKI